MAQPQLSDVHVNRPLTNVSHAYAVDPKTTSVARRMFPLVKVQNKSDSYYTYPKDSWFRNQVRKRALGTQSAGSGWDLSTDTYNCDVFALHKDIDDQIRANADSVFNLDAEATRFLTQQIMLQMDIDFASTFFAGSLWSGSTSGSDITPVTKWDAATGDPIKDIRAQQKSILKKTGQRANKMLFGRTAWDVVLDNAAVLDRIKGGSSNRDPAKTNEQVVASLLGLDEIIVADTVKNTASEGATASMSFVFTEDSALLVHAATAPGLLTPSAGYVFSWERYLSAPDGMRVKRMRHDLANSDRIEAEAAYDMKLVAADLGALFVSVDT